MGVHVYLRLAADRVDDATWQHIYADARRITKHWTPAPVANVWRLVGAARVAQYSTDIEHPDGLHIVGDAESLTTGERFVFPSKLDPPRTHDGSPSSPDGDILVNLSNRAPTVPIRSRELFGNKTQGFPYHTLIVALGLLVEHRLPSTAVVYGDLSRSDGEVAQRRLTEILGEHVELPVVADSNRLRARLAHALEGDDLDAAIRELGVLDSGVEALVGDLLGLLDHASVDARIRHELQHVAVSCRDPARLHAGTRDLFTRMLQTIRTNLVRAEVREQVEQWGIAHTRESIARTVWAAGLGLSQTAWDTIEVADLDELALLLAIAVTHSNRWEIHYAVRALLQNRTLREL